MNNTVCKKCGRECESPCVALKLLLKIYNEQRINEKKQLISALRKLLGFTDTEVSEELQQLGEKIIKRFPEFYIISEFDIRIGYALSYKAKKKDGKLVFAECHKVKVPYDAWLLYDFVIVFYDPNVATLTDNQRKILMLHELKHIGIGERGPCLVPHDIEDFESILREHGLNWNQFGNEVPDILVDILAGGDDAGKKEVDQKKKNSKNK